ncbi:hypothetical protein HDU67_002765 [Dinochytrium kinnereticum]|nr:hypothetical protein HDU67_002765 [Dinochytrium kinnereticum]
MSPSPVQHHRQQRCKSLDRRGKAIPSSTSRRRASSEPPRSTVPKEYTASLDLPGDDKGDEEDKTIVEDEQRPFQWVDRTPQIEVRGKPMLPSVLPRACLFFANLSSTKTDDELHTSVLEHFEKWGPTLNVKVQRDSQGRPFGFVQFQNISDAKRALKEAPKTVVDGREIRVEPANVNRTLFLSKFGSQIKYKELMERVEWFGPVEELTLLYHPGTRKCRGCAFVKYFSREDAITALTGIRRTYRYVCDWANRSEKSDVALDYSCLFIGKLNPEEVTEDLLRDRFGKYGEIKSMKLLKGQQVFSEQRDAFAFIRYATRESAEKAIDDENGGLWLGRVIKVKYREINDRRQSGEFTSFGSVSGYWEEGSGSEVMSPTSAGGRGGEQAFDYSIHATVPMRSAVEGGGEIMPVGGFIQELWSSNTLSHFKALPFTIRMVHRSSSWVINQHQRLRNLLTPGIRFLTLTNLIQAVAVAVNC